MSQVNLKKTNTPLAASVGRIGLFIDPDNQGRLIDEFGNIYALAGLKGDPGEGLAPGGNTGQVLAKVSNTDFDTQWVDQSGGSGTPTEIKTALETLTGNDRLSGDAIQGIITDITAGTNVTIDKTNPRIPVISSTGGTQSAESIKTSLETLTGTDRLNASAIQGIYLTYLASTGNILFDRPRKYGFGTALTGNIVFATTGASDVYMAKIRHNSATAPTFSGPGGVTLVFEGGEYKPSVNNYIYAIAHINDSDIVTAISYNISQNQV